MLIVPICFLLMFSCEARSGNGFQLGDDHEGTDGSASYL